MKGIGALSCIVFTILCAVAGSSTGFALRGVDWKFYGGVPIDGLNLCFYDANGVVREPGDHVRVWTKCLPQEALDRIDSEKTSEAAAQKIAKYYVPPYAIVEDIDIDQLLGVVVYEAKANIAYVQSKTSIFYELNCSERMQRELSVNLATGYSSHTARGWQYVSPEGNVVTLLKILCPSGN